MEKVVPLGVLASLQAKQGVQTMTVQGLPVRPFYTLSQGQVDSDHLPRPTLQEKTPPCKFNTW